MPRSYTVDRVPNYSGSMSVADRNVFRSLEMHRLRQASASYSVWRTAWKPGNYPNHEITDDSHSQLRNHCSICVTSFRQSFPAEIASPGCLGRMRTCTRQEADGWTLLFTMDPFNLLLSVCKAVECPLFVARCKRRSAPEPCDTPVAPRSRAENPANLTLLKTALFVRVYLPAFAADKRNAVALTRSRTLHNARVLEIGRWH